MRERFWVTLKKMHWTNEKRKQNHAKSCSMAAPLLIYFESQEGSRIEKGDEISMTLSMDNNQSKRKFNIGFVSIISTNLFAISEEAAIGKPPYPRMSEMHGAGPF